MILNLGCGARTSPRCVNIDRSIHMRIGRNPALLWLARLALNPDRIKHIEAVTANAVVHDLAKGIPYPDNSADAVYHSYMLQHIDRNLESPESDPAQLLLRECHRVLKPGGVLRVVVPDFEVHCRRYVEHLGRCRADETQWSGTDEVVSHLIGMSVRKHAAGSSHQHPVLRRIENALLGDARKRGETHQWEYDQFNLTALLRRAGFSLIEKRDYMTSRIPRWSEIGLDRTEDGNEYKRPSLYVEAVK